MSSIEPLEGNSCLIETELKDILTLNSCTALVSELIKFILYRKQQLPYTFDRLKYLITKRNMKERQKTPNVPSSIEKQFKVAQDGLSTLELLFEKTREELADSTKGRISEMALLFGSTPLTPKQVYRIHLPEVCLNHSSVNHPERKQLFHLLQSVILSNSLTNMLTKPMNPTNMFVFIRKSRKDKENEHLSNWFIPKNRYQIPKTGQHIHIKFRQPDSCATTCNCQDFKIYSDSTECPPSSFNQSTLLNDQESFNVNSGEDKSCYETEWYQACAIFKGFTDVYVNGVSVADWWLR